MFFCVCVRVCLCVVCVKSPFSWRHNFGPTSATFARPTAGGGEIEPKTRQPKICMCNYIL